MDEQMEVGPPNGFPAASDILFKDFNEDYTHNAIIRSGISKFFLFSDSYKTAALTLFEKLDGSAFYANTLVYPIVFLSRHFIELRLKELISGINYSLNEKYLFPDGHSLDKLWIVYTDVLIRAGESFAPDKEILENAEKIIKEFNLIDPNSMSFRYPVDKSSDRNPSLGITNLDLENFRTVMQKIFNFFDLQSDVVFHLIDIAEDFYTEMRREYHQEMMSYYYR